MRQWRWTARKVQCQFPMPAKKTRSPRHVFISGGMGSVGQALVEAFSAIGDRVVFQYHHDSRTAKDLHNSFRAHPIKLDFTRDFRMPEVNFDVVVNNAGINISDARTHEVTARDWTLTVTCEPDRPLFKSLSDVFPGMVGRRAGRIINISSIYGLRGVEGNCPIYGF